VSGGREEGKGKERKGENECKQVGIEERDKKKEGRKDKR